MSHLPNSISKDVRSVVCALLAAATTGGTVYSFSIYGEDLKVSLNLTQTQLSYISTSFFVAGIFSVIPGAIVDRWGPRFSIIAGGSMGAFATITFWLIGREILLCPSLGWTLSMLSLMGITTFMSCALIIGSTFKTVAASCSNTSAPLMIGIAKGYLGLGAGIYTCIFQAIPYTTSRLDFLPLCAVGFLTCGVLPASILMPRYQPQESAGATNSGGLRVSKLDSIILYTSFGCLTVLVTGHFVIQFLSPDDTNQILLAALVVLFWIFPILSILFAPREEALALTSSERVLLLDSGSASRQRAQPDAKAPQVTFGEMLNKGSAYILLFAVTVVVGQGTQMVNNMGQMVTSKRLGESMISASVALFSVAQAVSRVATGTISEQVWRTHGWFTRPFFVAIASFVAALGHGCLAIDLVSRYAFVLGICLSGVAFGMVWPLMVLIVKDLYGLRYFGTNYMFYDGLSCSIGTLLFSQLLTTFVYEQHTSPGQYNCEGSNCFLATHLVIAILSFVGGLACFVLQRLTRDLYTDAASLRGLLE